MGLKLNGKRIQEGVDFRYGHGYSLTDANLIMWFGADTEEGLSVFGCKIVADDIRGNEYG